MYRKYTVLHIVKCDRAHSPPRRRILNNVGRDPRTISGIRLYVPTSYLVRSTSRHLHCRLYIEKFEAGTREDTLSRPDFLDVLAVLYT